MREYGAVIVLFVASASLRADVIGAAGEAVTVGVTITRVAAGRIAWKTREGAEIERPLEQIEYLQIAGWPLFNVAEKQLREHYAHQACIAYEKAASELPDTVKAPAPGESGGLDRVSLVRARLVRAYEADRRFDRAVGAYVQLLDGADGTAWRTLRPRQVPPASSPELAAAAALVDAAIRRHADDEIAADLRRWRATWTATSRPASAPAVAPGTTDDGGGSDPAVVRARQLLQGGKYEEGLNAANELVKSTNGAGRAEAYYLQAQALLQRAAAKPAEAANDRRRAALALMRIAIHYPESPRAMDALYRVGRLCRDAGETAQARTLWLELIAHYPGDSDILRAARQDLERLAQTSATQPGETRNP